MASVTWCGAVLRTTVNGKSSSPAGSVGPSTKASRTPSAFIPAHTCGRLIVVVLLRWNRSRPSPAGVSARSSRNEHTEMRGSVTVMAATVGVLLLVAYWRSGECTVFGWLLLLLFF